MYSVQKKPFFIYQPSWTAVLQPELKLPQFVAECLCVMCKIISQSVVQVIELDGIIGQKHPRIPETGAHRIESIFLILEKALLGGDQA